MTALTFKIALADIMTVVKKATGRKESQRERKKNARAGGKGAV